MLSENEGRLNQGAAPWEESFGPIAILGHYPDIEIRAPLSGEFLQEFLSAIGFEFIALHDGLNARLSHLKSKLNDSELHQFLLAESVAFVEKELHPEKDVSYPDAPWRTAYSQCVDIPLMYQIEILGMLKVLLEDLKPLSSVSWQDLRTFFSKHQGMAVFQRGTIEESEDGGDGEDAVAEPNDISCSFAVETPEEIYAVPVLLEALKVVMPIFEECAVLQGGRERERQIVMRELWTNSAVTTDDCDLRHELAAESLLRSLARWEMYSPSIKKRLPFIKQEIDAGWDQFQIAVALKHGFIKDTDSCCFEWPDGAQTYDYRRTEYARLSPDGKKSIDRLCLKELRAAAEPLGYVLSLDMARMLPLKLTS